MDVIRQFFCSRSAWQKASVAICAAGIITLAMYGQYFLSALYAVTFAAGFAIGAMRRPSVPRS